MSEPGTGNGAADNGAASNGMTGSGAATSRATASRQPRTRVRRARSVTESLLSIVLALEAFLVFFVALVLYGLRAADVALAFGGGAIFIVLLILGGGVLRYRWGIWYGWALQLVLIATGFLLPILFLVAAVFVGIWTYCFIKGRQIDAQKADYLAAYAEANPEADSTR